MKGLVIWSHSYCRSTLAFYNGLGKSLACNAKIIVLKGLSEARKKSGFDESEFHDLDINPYEGIESSFSIFDKFNNYLHIFGTYQSLESVRLISVAIKKGILFGVCSEAPCNMSPYPKRILKELYIRLILPIKVRNIIRHAVFFLFFSGDDKKSLTSLGWNENKIIPCGYYSPALIGSKPVCRTKLHWKNFTILLTGIHEWHRSPMILLRALHELDKRGVFYRCNITQEGPMLEKMKRYAQKNNMQNIFFWGFVPLHKLVDMYETCSVYVGTGNNEPWGMRLNDALQCGAPLIINRGMGGAKFVRDYDCGLLFDKNDFRCLADCLENLIKNRDLYEYVSIKAYHAAKEICPNEVANKIAMKIQQLCDNKL